MLLRRRDRVQRREPPRLAPDVQHVALNDIAVETTQYFELAGLLRALRHDRHVQAASESDDALQQLARAFGLGDAVDEDAIDLELVERQLG